MPGMRIKVEGMSPAKMAMAEQAIMAPTAGSGSMKKVSGTRRAMAMVAVRPGMAPTTRPKAEAARMVRSTSHRITIMMPVSMAPIRRTPR